MSDILSQSEIDALVASMNSGGSVSEAPPVEKKGENAKKYDFLNPQKFSKEQTRTLENIFDNFARSVSSFLTGYLRTSVHLEVSSSEEIMYRDFSVALANPVILTMFHMSPLKGTAIVDMSSNVGYAIIDRILGGPGFGPGKLRDFSEIEKILLERVMLQVLNFLPESWEGILPIRPRLDKIETNTQFAQIIAQNDKVALIVLTIKVGSSEGNVTFCLPYGVLEPIVDRLYARYGHIVRDDSDKEIYREKIESELEGTVVPLSVEVGKSKILVNDFVNLQPGDIIPLDSYITSNVSVLANGLHKFHAKPGVHRGKYAVKIVGLVEKEDLKDE